MTDSNSNIFVIIEESFKSFFEEGEPDTEYVGYAAITEDEARKICAKLNLGADSLAQERGVRFVEYSYLRVPLLDPTLCDILSQ